MANHKSAKTRIVRNNKRSLINAKDKEAAAAAFITAESEMMRAAQKGVFKKNTASRTISRLAQKIKAL